MKVLNKFRSKRKVSFEKTRTLLAEKIRESLVSVLPIIVIVTLLCLFLVPMQPNLLLTFLIGALMIVVGMGLFSLGAERSMTVIGAKIGTALTKVGRLPVILLAAFALGVAVTVAEPDLQVLADTVPNIDKTVLLMAVGAGVGLFMVVCMLRILYGINLRWVLVGCYIAVFALAAFADRNFLSIAFDSGGVTTGPMTVPFILSLGVGISHVRSDRQAEADSFGLVALCSIGPILSVLLLGFLGNGDGGASGIVRVSLDSTTVIGTAFMQELPLYMKEMAIAMLPIVAIFVIFQMLAFRMSGRNFTKIFLGILYTYVGLVLFLTGVNVGFSGLGAELGAALADGGREWMLIPLSAVLGWFIISAEPAVAVLEKQIEDVSAGAIPGRAIKRSLSIAIALAMALAMVRVVTGISVLWFLAPGYAIALGLSFFVPDIYTAIAFDSGGVASGPMTATFMLQFMMGVSIALGGNVLTDAFGIVALVAMMPLLSIQMVGFYYQLRAKKVTQELENYGDCDIIELWEEPA